MANSTEKGEEGGDMDINSPEQMGEMQDVVTSPAMNNQLDNTPCQVDKHLDFLLTNKKGHVLLGSSSLTGRYWGGSLWYYDDPALCPSVEKCLVGYEVGSGIPDGAFVDQEKLLMVGHDNGGVEFLKLLSEDNSRMQMRSLCRVAEHMDAVTCVEVTCHNKTALTGSADMSIREWNLETSLVSRVLGTAHSQQLTSLSPHPTNDQLFLSSGMDGNVLLWDLRCPKPASCIYRDWDDKPECVSWMGEGDRYLLGLQSGRLLLRSTAHLNHSLTSHQALHRPLYRIVLNPARAQVAVCGNDSKTLVLDVSEQQIKQTYEDDRHTDFVRGLAWLDADSIISCGWDSSVYIHRL